jgi:hypothetical protein
MSAKSHIAYSLRETWLYKEFKRNSKLTSHFGGDSANVASTFLFVITNGIRAT